MSSIYDWSLEADKNANSDEIINWEHGQPPSSVNGSARSMMKRIAEYIKDLSGTVQASGDGNEVSVNLFSNISKYQDGVRFYFRPNITNTKAMKLRVGALALLPVFQTKDNGLSLLDVGACQKDGLYEIIYSSKLDKDGGGWFITNPTRSPKNISSIPPGVIIHYSDAAYDKEGWLICDGTNVSKAKYSALYNIIGDKWGTSSKGPDYFAVPDFRGVFLRGLDNGKGLDSNREFASFQASANKAHTHSATCNEAGEHSHDMLQESPDDNPGAAYPNFQTGPGKYLTLEPPPIKAAGTHTHDITIQNAGESEARPCNYSVLYLIKT